MNAYIPSQEDIDVLARTIYGEARGEYSHDQGGLAAFIAVANVVMNRLQNPHRFGSSIIEVCQRRYQFSCWNKSDPNFPIITAIEKGTDKLFELARLTAEQVACGKWPDLTRSSNHYHAMTLQRLPKWAQGHRPQVLIGRHIFYCIAH